MHRSVIISQKPIKEECKTLGLDYIDISEKGSFRILL